MNSNPQQIRKVGRPYKNPNLLPQPVADAWRKARHQRDEALRVLKLVLNNVETRFGVDKETNEPLSEIIGRTIRNIEKENE